MDKDYAYGNTKPLPATESINAACATQAQTSGGMLGKGKCLEDASRDNLRDRIHSQLRRSEREARKTDSLQELAYLLDKNPEIARILDLMEGIDKY